MKTMSCKQLGGACEKKFYANSFEEIAQMSKQHGMKMFQIKDETHLKAMNQMQELMKKPDAMNKSMNNIRPLKTRCNRRSSCWEWSSDPMKMVCSTIQH